MASIVEAGIPFLRVVRKPVEAPSRLHGGFVERRSLVTVHQLGDLFAAWHGDIPQDFGAAESAFTRACALGAQDACKSRQYLKEGGVYAIRTSLEEVIVSPKKWAGKLVGLSDVRVSRFGPFRGMVVPAGGKLADGLSAKIDDDTGDDAKRDWLKVPSGASRPIAGVVADVYLDSLGVPKLIVREIEL